MINGTKTRSLVLTAAFAAALGCSNTALLESTTTTPNATGVTIAKSADGMLELVIPEGGVDLDTKIRIDTRRDLRAENTVGLIYTITPANLQFLKPAEVRIYLPIGITGENFRIITLDATTKSPLFGSRYEAEIGWARALITSLERNTFTLEGGPYQPCEAVFCGQACSNCAPGDTTCTRPSGFCNDTGACLPEEPVCELPEAYNAAAGVGPTFILNQLAITDGSRLSPLGELGNDQIRQQVLGGESMLLLELAGLDHPYNGNDGSLTFKMYAASDADDPFYPANNFRVPMGHTTCCEFMILQSSLSATNGAARSRLPAVVQTGHLHAHGQTKVGLGFFPIGPWPVVMTDVNLTLPVALDELRHGTMNGVARIADLAWTENPYCRTVSPRCTVQFIDASMLDLVATLIATMPDVDLDGDGIERVQDTNGDGRIDTCFDGCTGSCTTPEMVPPVFAEDPSSCAISPRMADGYSISMAFTAVPASVIGIKADSDPRRVHLFPPIGQESTVYGRAESGAFGWPFTRLHLEARVGLGQPVYKEKIVRIGRDYAFNFAIDGVLSSDLLTITPVEGPFDVLDVQQTTLTVPPLAPPSTRYVCCRTGGPGTCQTETQAAAGQPCPHQQPGVNMCHDDTGCDALNRIEAFPTAPVEARVVAEGLVAVELHMPVDEEPALLEAENVRTGQLEYAAIGDAGYLELDGVSGDTIRVRLYYADGVRTRVVERTVQ